MEHEVEISDLEGTTATISVKVTRGFYVRTWLALQLVKLAARIANIGLTIEREPPAQS